MRAPGGLRSAAAPGLGRGAERRLPGRGQTPVTAAAVTARAAPAGEPAAAQSRASPAGRARGSQEGGEARQEPARRPVPCRALARPQRLPPQRGEPAVPGASCLLPRAGIAEQRAAGPAPLHPAARPEPPQLCHADSPLGWEVGFLSPLSPSRRTPPAPSSSPGHSPRCNPSRFLDGAAGLCQSPPSPFPRPALRGAEPGAPTAPGGRRCPRGADPARSAAPERSRRGVGDPSLRALPARESGTAHPGATAGLQGSNPAQLPDGCSAESFPAGWKGWMGSAASITAVAEPGLRHRHRGAGQHLHPHTKTVPAQQRSSKPLLKCFWLRSHG